MGKRIIKKITKEKYQKLTTKDPNTIYIAEDNSLQVEGSVTPARYITRIEGPINISDNPEDGNYTIEYNNDNTFNLYAYLTPYATKDADYNVTLTLPFAISRSQIYNYCSGAKGTDAQTYAYGNICLVSSDTNEHTINIKTKTSTDRTFYTCIHLFGYIVGE